MSLDDTFTALADPTRRGVIGLLRRQPRRASDLAEALGASRPAMSRHLRVLRASGLVSTTGDDSDDERDHRERIYQLEPDPFAQLRAWVEEVEQFWMLQLDAFKAHVEGTTDRALASRPSEATTKPREHGRGDAGRGRGHVARGRGEVERGRGNAERRRGDSVHGRGESERGPGDAEHGRGEAERGRGDVERRLGDVARGRGEAERGPSDAARGRGEAERGPGDVARGRAEAERGRGDAQRARGDAAGRGGGRYVVPNVPGDRIADGPRRRRR